VAVPIGIQVLQENGSPISFGAVQFYKHTCVWVVCADNYQFGLGTDFYGRLSTHLDPAEWLVKASWQGFQGQARFKLTNAGIGTVAQSGRLIVVVHRV
jgi:hypothetical protein